MNDTTPNGQPETVAGRALLDRWRQYRGELRKHEGLWLAADEFAYQGVVEAIPVIEAEARQLVVERLRQAILTVSVRHDWEHTVDREDRTAEIAAEYAGLAADTYFDALREWTR